MAQKGVQMTREFITCPVCLDLLKDPVTIPCGHSYCMECIKIHWDKQDMRRVYSCPQCRKTFSPRPVLGKNTVLADLVGELQKSGLQDAPADHCFAGPEDVACDVCTGRKRKASKSCLQCLVSYCEEDLQLHYVSPAFKKHKLAEPSKMLQEAFCQTDSESTIAAAVEMTERQRELEGIRKNIRQRIQDRQNDVELLQQEMEAISGSADKAVEHSEKIFTELICLLEKRRCDVKQQVRSQQETEVNRVKELQEKLEQEIAELKMKDAELQKLSHAQDDLNQFLQDYPSLSALGESKDSFSINIRPLKYFEDVTAAVSEGSDKLQEVLREEWTNISQTLTEVDGLLSQPEPKTRADFLNYARDITLDPNTINMRLSLSEGNRRATLMSKRQSHPSHPDRFMCYNQVLSRESLTGRCYWEVEWNKKGVYVAVVYKCIRRKGISDDCCLPYSDKAWALECLDSSYDFWHNFIRTPVSGPWSNRLGVYLDHSAGILSFYSIAETMTLLHRAQTRFVHPLHVALWLRFPTAGLSAEICKLR
ncbi:tripartite motif-containing protein 16-like [Halichoeres trimaculatus]|uniref:tripartite motif-containing protein 16-like n=1 Tax=Halichoeres trimaculatus TaxID=147232 RepID=UPI003D9FA008